MNMFDRIMGPAAVNTILNMRFSYIPAPEGDREYGHILGMSFSDLMLRDTGSRLSSVAPVRPSTQQILLGKRGSSPLSPRTPTKQKPSPYKPSAKAGGSVASTVGSSSFGSSSTQRVESMTTPSGDDDEDQFHDLEEILPRPRRIRSPASSSPETMEVSDDDGTEEMPPP
jgi:hypothetical protein